MHFAHYMGLTLVAEERHGRNAGSLQSMPISVSAPRVSVSEIEAPDEWTADTAPGGKFERDGMLFRVTH